MVSFFVLFISMRIVYADYQCLCNYSVEKPVYAATSTSSTRLGYLYEFDCKPLAEHQSSNADVIAVQFLTQVGYVYLDPQTREETCPGNPSVLDLVPPPSQRDIITTNDNTIRSTSPISSPPTTVSVPHVGSSSSSDPTISTTVSVPHVGSSSSSDPTISTPRITRSVSKSTVSSLPASKLISTTFTSALTGRTTTGVFTTSSMLSASAVALSAETHSSTSTSRVPPAHGSTSEKSSSTAHTRWTTSTMTRSTQAMTSRQSPSSAHTTTSKTTTPPPTTATATTKPPRTTATITPPPPTTTTPPTTIPPTTTPPTTTTPPATTATTTPPTTTPPTTTTPPATTTATTTPPTTTTTTTPPTTTPPTTTTPPATTATTTPPTTTATTTPPPTTSATTAPPTKPPTTPQSTTPPTTTATTTPPTTKTATTTRPTTPPTTTTTTPTTTTASTSAATKAMIYKMTSTHSTTVSGGVDQCPNRSNRNLTYFRQYGHLCYELRPGVKDWRSAESDCEQNGGTLVVIHDSVTQQRIMSMIHDLRYNHPLWIGLYDLRTEGSWEWIDGRQQTPGAFGNWDPGHRHPVYHNERDCALMDSHSGRWKEVECWGFLLTMQRNSWICQYNLP